MPKSEGRRNTIVGTGNIVTGGTFTGSPVSATTAGRVSHNPFIRQLQDELTRVRQCLAEVEATTADHEDAIEAVIELQAEVAQDPDPDERGRRRLRKRVRQVIGVLTPVAEVIGAVAALEEIWKHL